MELKHAAGRPGPKLGLPVGAPTAAWLRPVATRREDQDPRDVRCLTEWRNRFVTSFLTEFGATEPRTARWLADTVGPDPGRILFMVDDLSHRPFGYMGIGFIDWDARSGEADSIVRGGEAPRGLMTQALQTLLGWARGQLGLETLAVRVRSDNSALEFYRKLGFVEERRVPLVRAEGADGVVWSEEPGASSDVSLVHLFLKET